MSYFEHLSDKFNFGKFKNCALGEVLMYSPTYLNWVVENVDGSMCCLSDTVIEEMHLVFPTFNMNDKFKSYCIQRQLEYNSEHEEDITSYDVNDSFLPYQEERTYECYSGSYAQDEMGYSDDDIDIIFDGDPLAYWNID